MYSGYSSVLHVSYNILPLVSGGQSGAGTIQRWMVGIRKQKSAASENKAQQSNCLVKLYFITVYYCSIVNVF